jgi:hypothetical protein
MRAIDARPGEEILDVGCAAERMVEAVRAHVEVAVVKDIEALSFGRTYDRVVCVGVLDFVADPAHCFARLATHVQSGGWLVVLAPRRGLPGLYYRIAQRLRGIRVQAFDLAALDARASALGLELEVHDYPLPNSIVARWRRAPTPVVEAHRPASAA